MEQDVQFLDDLISRLFLVPAENWGVQYPDECKQSFRDGSAIMSFNGLYPAVYTTTLDSMEIILRRDVSHTHTGSRNNLVCDHSIKQFSLTVREEGKLDKEFSSAYGQWHTYILYKEIERKVESLIGAQDAF